MSRDYEDAPALMSSHSFRHFHSNRLPDPHLTPLGCLFPHRSPRQSSANAACGRFRASPRRTAPKGHTLHLPRSTTSRSPTYLKLLSTFVAHLRHYYEAVRPAAPHRYSPPHRFSCLEFSLTPTMSTHDQPHRSERFPRSAPEPDTELAPPLRRTPPGQEHRNPPDSSQGNNWTPVSAVVATLSTFHQWFTHVRLLGSHLTHHVRVFRNAHHPGSFTDAACGGLRPPPAWAVPEGLPPSPVQHRIQRIPSTSEPPSAFVAHSRQRNAR